MAKKKKHEEEHADERWLITYADVLTLLFVLFMVLFSMSVVNTGKYEALRDSLAGSFSAGIFEGGKSAMYQGGTQDAAASVQTPGGVITPQVSPSFGASLANSTPEASLENAQLEEVKKAIDAEAKKSGVSSSITTSIDEKGLKIRLRTEPFLFASGSATLDPRASTLLDPVGRAVKPLVNPIVVEGHTDSDPIRTAQFPSNYWLGSGRALAVQAALMARGVNRAQEASSRGASQPIIDNSTAAHKAQNRRVEILVLRINPVGTNPTP